jgi:hypothetical protein
VTLAALISVRVPSVAGFTACHRSYTSHKTSVIDNRGQLTGYFVLFTEGGSSSVVLVFLKSFNVLLLLFEKCLADSETSSPLSQPHPLGT